MIPNMYKIAGELTSAVHPRGGQIACSAGTVDLRRPLRRDGRAPDRIRTAGVGLGAGGARPGAGRAGGHAARPGCRSCTSSTASAPPTSSTRLRRSPTTTCGRWCPRSWSAAHRGRALSPERPFIRGTAQNPDVYFQARETVNPFYARVPGVVRGPDGHAWRAHRPAVCTSSTTPGTQQAERVLVADGLGRARPRRETVAASASQRGERVGMIRVRLFQPSSRQRRWSRPCLQLGAFSELRCSTAPRNPARWGSRSILKCARCADGGDGTDERPAVFARYPEGDRWSTTACRRRRSHPSMLKPGCSTSLNAEHPKRHFTVGIYDDVTRLQPSGRHRSPTTRPPGEVSGRVLRPRIRRHGRSEQEDQVKIIGEHTDLFAQGYCVYDSKNRARRPSRICVSVHSDQRAVPDLAGELRRLPPVRTARARRGARSRGTGSDTAAQHPARADQIWDALPDPCRSSCSRKASSCT